MIEKAVETELQFFLSQYENVTDLSGRKTVVRNGWLKLRGFNRLPDVVRGTKFQDGIAVLDEANDIEYKQQNIAT